MRTDGRRQLPPYYAFTHYEYLMENFQGIIATETVTLNPFLLTEVQLNVHTISFLDHSNTLTCVQINPLDATINLN